MASDPINLFGLALLATSSLVIAVAVAVYARGVHDRVKRLENWVAANLPRPGYDKYDPVAEHKRSLGLKTFGAPRNRPPVDYDTRNSDA